jgi:hypothetical protein
MLHDAGALSRLAHSNTFLTLGRRRAVSIPFARETSSNVSTSIDAMPATAPWCFNPLPVGAVVFQFRHWSPLSLSRTRLPLRFAFGIFGHSTSACFSSAPLVTCNHLKQNAIPASARRFKITKSSSTDKNIYRPFNNLRLNLSKWG